MTIAGVTAVHDLHVWTVTSGFDAMSCHLTVANLANGKEALRQARRVLKDEFGIDHVTIQVEDEALRAEELVLHV
jgi:cobalt-zinc-cadmium efflux system protein